MAEADVKVTPRTRVGAVMGALHERIANRSLIPGARVPSIRMMADALGVSKSTVVEAYDRLAGEGVLVARRGSGFFVSGHAPPLALADLGPRLDREVDPLWLTRQSLEAAGNVLKPGCGWLPTAWLPEDNIRRALRSVARDTQASVVEYATPSGLPALRQQLTWRLAQQGIHVEPGQVVLTDGGTHALDLVCRFLLEPGDTVLLDDPCYFNFQALLRAHRVSIVSVPYTPNGPDLACFERALIEHRPRLYISNAAIHNRRKLGAGRCSSLAETRWRARSADRGRRYLRRFRKRSRAAPGSLRWSDARCLNRQFFKNTIGGDALRLHRSAQGMG